LLYWLLGLYLHHVSHGKLGKLQTTLFEKSFAKVLLPT
jgi:hypothetical protein